MSRRESDREDLLREATALVERAELQVQGFDETVIVGFRQDGAASIFFGADPVYQFNAAGELRRAFVGGLLYKAERGKLVSLRRERTETETALMRRELSDGEADALGVEMRERLRQLEGAMAEGRFAVNGERPDGSAVWRRIHGWLARFPQAVVIAGVPNVA
jgi:hypothetical protein